MAVGTKSGVIQVLHLEDNEIDHLLVQSMMEGDGIDCEFFTVQNRVDFESALMNTRFDLIISDFTLPAFDGLTGLFLARQLAPKTPFIFFSGTIGEETAVESLMHGASDYVIKHRPRRLLPAIRGALEKAREQALLEETQKRNREQAALLDKARDGIMVCDLNHRIVYWNKGAERIYGWTSAEAMGRDVTELLFTEDPPANVYDSFKQAFEQGEWSGELEQSAKDGRSVVVQARATLIYNENGQPKSLLLINTDVTESKRLEEKLQRAHRMENLGALVSGITHDLNNALAPILIGVDLLREANANDPALVMIEKSVRHGTEMVRQILTFARGHEIKKDPTDVGRLLREIDKVIECTFPKNIRCQVKLDGNLWTVAAVGTQIYQVLMNLCVNARDAMPKGGALVLTARNLELGPDPSKIHPEARSGDYVCVSVADTGSGMPPAQLEKIFEPFFTTKPVGKGTGLGLSNCLQIVKNHGGFMTVNSQVDVGTEFLFYLPAFSRMQLGLARDAVLLPGGHGECILVVDHEASMVALVRSALENFGYQVAGVASAWEAMTFLEVQREMIQLLMINVNVPLAGKLIAAASAGPDTRRIRTILTGGAKNEVADESRTQLKADARVPKPFTMEQLLMTVQQVLVAEGPLAATAKPNPKSRRILVVDDDPIISKSVQLLLQADGHQVTTADVSSQALGLLDQHGFDLAMIDYTMPEMSGDELAAAIKVKFPGLPLIMTTAYADQLSMSGRMPAGVDLVIGKPFTRDELRQAVARFSSEDRPSIGS